MYDALVVGARCAGSLTGMLLARRGHRVLVVDRDAVDRDVLCGHYLAPAGVGALAEHGLLERLLATGCPAAESTLLFIGTTTLEVGGATCSPRRRVLDTILADAAARTGAEVRQGFTVTDVVWEGERVVGVVGHGESGRSVVERARIVVGADGRHSFVADAVGARRHLEQVATTCCYYAYWVGLAGIAPQVHMAEGRVVSLFPTHDGLTCVVATRPVSEWVGFKRAPEAEYMRQMAGFPRLRHRLAAGRRESRFFGTADLGGCFRQAWGPGWALVGDAGHHRDPLLGSGMGDALVQASLLADALDSALTGRVRLDRALAAYEGVRDRAWRSTHEATTGVASFSWSQSELPGRLEALAAATRATAKVLQNGVGDALAAP